MKAALMHGIGEPLTIEDVSIDRPDPGEVLVQVIAAGVCHSDLVFMDGRYSHELPTILGHESAGVVLDTGDDVTVVSPGDHVVTTLSASCGRCPYCAEDTRHLCSRKEDTRRRPGSVPRLSAGGEAVHQFLDLSSFAEQILVHQSTVVKIPQSVPLDRAALLGCGVATGLGAVFNTAAVAAGQSVAIIGCGGVGLAAVQGARIAGAETIIAIDLIDEKLELAVSLGATDTVNASQSDPVSYVREITSGHGVHHAIEALGTTATAQRAFDMLRRGGTATIVGLIPDQTLRIPTDDLFYERRVQGSVMGSNQPTRDIPRYVDMYVDGLLNLDDMVTRRIVLDGLNEAFEDIRAGRAVRSIVVFDAQPPTG
jgi:S-(hydroxymethyl)glutathione dehydrogenase/alcohol dehydrogenase